MKKFSLFTLLIFTLSFISCQQSDLLEEMPVSEQNQVEPIKDSADQETIECASQAAQSVLKLF